ncbi:MAG: hypothetical protein NXI12_12430 [Alphaproteobacteria bacterium]|nr:hypothetical protein [Alphaproteobacteria bacterium]
MKQFIKREWKTIALWALLSVLILQQFFIIRHIAALTDEVYYIGQSQ